MNLFRANLLLLILTIFVIKAQGQLRIKLNIELSHIENRNKKLKNCKVVISQGKDEIESFTATKNKFKKTIDSKGIYKFEFSKKNYVSKHFIVDVLDIPKSRKRHVLKAEVTLFKKSEKFDVRFLEKEPISIAYYDYTNKVLKWDFDYNRTMIEKIIEAQLID
ncbi:MAG: Uncharacterised protein [Crocinitomicaceae bacterium]|nr:MAG: Uncharacterised protein [Crocinitomicaceae bacterium]